MTSAGDPQKLPVTEVREDEGRKPAEDGWRTIHFSVCVEGCTFSPRCPGSCHVASEKGDNQPNSDGEIDRCS